MKLSGIIETALYTDDLIDMRDFYQNILGLTCIAYKEKQHAFFKINRSVLLIFNRAFTADQTATVNGSKVPPHATNGPGQVHPAKPDIFPARQCGEIKCRDCDSNSIEITEYGLWED